MAPPAAPEILRNADLAELSTFRLPARAAELVVIDSPKQLTRLPPAQGPELILGGGSNTVFVADFPGRVIVNRIRGTRLEADGDEVLISSAAGENWHALVKRCIGEDLHGVENLVMIPGSVGAAPVQNIGAYGVELSSVFESLHALDRQSGRFVTLEREACCFGYRESRFKSTDRDRFLIVEITLRLSKTFSPNAGYDSLATELERIDNTRPTPRQLVAAIMRLRRHRLPDPARLANAGSFFQNPVVETGFAQRLLAEHPALPHWPTHDGRVKLAAAWMIEQLGWKGRSLGRVGVYRNHALVLVNHGGASAGELLDLVAAITDSVQQRFGIVLQPEPNLVGRGRL